ncbi:MAG: hypothetical protein WC241_05025 [Candidatus Paceibacterota bacterium]|jgi:hypothetical protein
MIYQTAKDAIEHSISHDGIAYCEDSEENRDYLSSEADDYTESNDCMEYWADADDSDGKMEWRVHIQIAE